MARGNLCVPPERWKRERGTMACDDRKEFLPEIPLCFKKDSSILSYSTANAEVHKNACHGVVWAPGHGWSGKVGPPPSHWPKQTAADKQGYQESTRQKQFH